MGDTEPPVVIQTTPVTASTGVSSATTIQFVFSEPMNPQSVVYVFTPPIAFNAPVWTSLNSVLTLTPTAPLSFSTTYSAAIGGQDVAGNAIAPPFNYAFTTEAMSDTTPPTLVSTAPDNNAVNVPTTSGLVLTFSEPMNPTSVQVAFSPQVMGVRTWSNNDTELAFTPSMALAANTTYAVTVNGSDVAGNALTPAPMIRFTTAAPPDTTPPTVVTTFPADNAVNVAPSARISVTFSEPMNTASVDVSPTPDPGLGPPTWSNNNQTVSFSMQTSAWPTSTTVVWEIDGRDAAGNPLATVTRRFSTAAPPDTTPPTVNSTAPANMATMVPRQTNIEFNFSEPMNRVQTEAAFSSNPAITCSFTWNIAGTLMVCDPTADLAGTTPYTITLGTGSRDVAGNALAAPYVFSFGTAAVPDTTRPTITSTTPANNAVGAPRVVLSFPSSFPAPIRVTFSEAMSQASAQNAFTIMSPAGFNGGTFGWDRNTMIYTPPAYFAYGQQVTFQVGASAADLAGNTLGTNYTGTFRIRRRTTANFYNDTPALDGYLTSSIACTNVTVSANSSVARAGDSFAGNLYRGYLSFSLAAMASLQNAVVTSATLNTEQTYCTTGSVFTATFGNAIEAHHVSYGASLDALDCNVQTLANREYTLSTSQTLGPRSASVTAAVQDDYANRASRGNRSQFQIRTRIVTTDGDAASDYCNVGTTSSGTPPYLTVTYEYD